MEEQGYYCEKCCLKSSVQYDKHEDVLFVMRKIKDDHELKSPNCDASVLELRIVDIE
jgi:hypothetical protein